MIYSRKYVVTPARNIILIPKNIPYKEGAEFVGVRVVLSSEKRSEHDQFIVDTDKPLNEFGDIT